MANVLSFIVLYLALLMVAGRLEIYTILFAPTFWRR